MCHLKPILHYAFGDKQHNQHKTLWEINNIPEKKAVLQYEYLHICVALALVCIWDLKRTQHIFIVDTNNLVSKYRNIYFAFVLCWGDQLCNTLRWACPLDT